MMFTVNNLFTYVYTHSRKLIELIDDDERRRAMAVRGMESINRFNTPAIARQWLELFEQVSDNR